MPGKFWRARIDRPGKIVAQRLDDEIAVALDQHGIHALADAAGGGHAGRAARFEPAHVIVDVAHLQVDEVPRNRVAFFEVLKDQPREAAIVHRRASDHEVIVSPCPRR